MQARNVFLGALVGVALLVLCTGIIAAVVDGAGDSGSSTPSITTVEGDPTRLDAAAKLACEDLIAGFAGAQTRQARVNLADKVNKWASKSITDGIAEGGKALGRSAEAADQVWTLAGDTFAAVCIRAGWPTKAP